MIAFAVVFLLVLFLVKTKTSIKNIITSGIEQESDGLVYSAEPLENLISKDSDKDGVLDWEEGLWGTDPNKKDTDANGTEDGEEIEKLKTEQKENQQDDLSLTIDDENLTKTDQFSRELIATIATLSQNGGVDQETIDKIGLSLAEQVKNTPVEKVYELSDLKIIKDESVLAVQNYKNTFNKINNKYPTDNTVMKILSKFIIDEEYNVDLDVLEEFTPIIENTQKTIDDFIMMSVPNNLAILHLSLINALQTLLENVISIKLYDEDPILSLSAISQYEENVINLHSVFNQLKKIIE